MNKIYIVILISFCWIGNLNAQFGYRVLNKEQSSDSFVQLKFQTLNDSIGTGYGFPNPTNNNSIVLSKDKPKGEKTKDWSELDVKYVEIYKDKSLSKLLKLLLTKNEIDSLKTKSNIDKKSTVIDTIKIYHLRKMRGGVANGLNSMIYENKKVRLFGAIVWENYYVPHQLVFFQTTELSVYESDTYYLNYNNHKAFKRSAKRLFKKCPQMIERANKGEYFPRNKKNLKKIADDYESLCSDE
jgi:hypothetical protein